MQETPCYVYIMTTRYNSVLYTGATSDLLKRAIEHRQGLSDSFSKKYKTTKLVYYETADNLEGALYREKQIKKYSRNKKMDLIDNFNPCWEDLFVKLLAQIERNK